MSQELLLLEVARQAIQSIQGAAAAGASPRDGGTSPLLVTQGAPAALGGRAGKEGSGGFNIGQPCQQQLQAPLSSQLHVCARAAPRNLVPRLCPLHGARLHAYVCMQPVQPPRN